MIKQRIHLMLTLLLFVSSSVSAMSLDNAKKQCSELGFQTATEKYGECVLKLYNSNGQTSSQAAENRLLQRQLEYEQQARQDLINQQIENQRALNQQLRNRNSENSNKALGNVLQQIGGQMMEGGNSNRREPVTCFSQPNGVGGEWVNCH